MNPGFNFSDAVGQSSTSCFSVVFVGDVKLDIIRLIVKEDTMTMYNVANVEHVRIE